MSSLMLVNPKKRKSHRSPGQKAATRRMIAVNRSKRHSNPHRRTKRHSVSRVVRHHNPVRARYATHRRIKRHRNPSGLTSGGITGMLMNGLKGAGGAIVVNVVTNYLPDAVKTGNLVYISRTVLALALGTFGRKILGNNARAMAEGALTVNFHDFINSVAGAMLPGSTMHGMGEYMAGSSGLSRNLPGAAPGGTQIDSELNGMGEYMYR